MCRDKNNGGRRCPHDNNTARRNRRVNAKKKLELKDDVVEQAESYTLNVETSLSPEVEKVINDVKSDIDKYNSLKLYTPKEKKELPHHTTPTTTKERKADTLIINAGIKIEELAQHFGCPAESDWEENIKERDNIEKKYDDIFVSMAHRMSNTLCWDIEVDSPDRRRFVLNGRNMPESWAHDSNYKLLKDSGITSDGNQFMKEYEELATYKKNKRDELLENENKYDEIAKKRGQAYREALERVGVEFAGTDDLKFNTDYSNEYKEKLAKAGSYYPKAWVDKSNNHKVGLDLIVKGNRANFYSGRIQISAGEKESVVVHELGHRMEWVNYNIGEAQRRFIARRSGLNAYHDKEVRKQPKTHTLYANTSERGYGDNFSSSYIGKVYDVQSARTMADMKKYNIAATGDAHYEVLTTGMEATFFGRYGGNLGVDGYKRDKEHTHFILGLLATANK